MANGFSSFPFMDMSSQIYWPGYIRSPTNEETGHEIQVGVNIYKEETRMGRRKGKGVKQLMEEGMGRGR